MFRGVRRAVFIFAGLMVFSACDGQETASSAIDAAPVDGSMVDATPPDAAAETGVDATVMDAALDAMAERPALLTSDAILAAVDPFIGSGGMGFGYAAMTPAAQRPHGMMRLGPDTTNGGRHLAAHHFSGYHFDDPDARGFSHVRLVGTGVGDLGLLRVLPQTSLDGPPPRDRFAPMDKATERAAPGEYAVTLTAPSVDVSLAAAAHAGVHRYVFHEDGAVWLLVDATAAIVDRPVDGAQIAYADGQVTGQVDWQGGFTGRSRGFTLSFDMQVTPAPTEVRVWSPEGAVPGEAAVGEHATLALGWRDVADLPIELRVGVSYIDAAQARANREAELSEHTLEEVVAEARAEWLQRLGRVRVGGGTPAQQRIFYTALYHTYAMPTRFAEADGRYRGLDGEVHEGDGFTYLSDLSLWDTFRTLHPWYELADPDTERNCLRSLLAMDAQGGSMPRWPANLSYAGSMIGSSADLLFAGGAAKGIDGVDYDAAFEALMKAASGPVPHASRGGIEGYLAHGYVPADEEGESVSKTVEYAYSDAALADLAARLGRPEAAALAERGRNYRNLFHPERHFFAPRLADGTWSDFTETQIDMGGGDYVEGNAWHWRFSALQDPADLAALFGGPEALGEALDTFFNYSQLGQPGYSTFIPDLYYWHGNEPDLHAALLYHAAGRPDAMADKVRLIQRAAYRDAPAGLNGNDDGGTLSAWYLFTALGLYPIAGSDAYLFASPLFPYAEIDTADGPLIIEAPGASDEVRYVREARVGDRLIEGARVLHGELLTEKRLDFRLSADPY